MAEHVREKGSGNTYVFIPFKEKSSKEHIDSSLGYATEVTEDVKIAEFKEDALYTCLDTKHTGKNLFEFMVNEINKRIDQSANDVIYIRGHSKAGADSIESSDHSETITAKELAKLLKPICIAFSGHFKIYACNSGKGVPSSNVQSFAQRFADEMSALGFKKCHFYGYTESLTTFRFPQSDTSDPHKWTNPKGQAMPWQRASTARVEVVPNELKVSSTCIIS